MKKILAFSCSTDATVDVVIRFARNVKIDRFDTDKIKPHLIFADYLGNSSLDKYDVIWYRRPFEFEKKTKKIDGLIQQKEWKEIVWNHFLQVPKEKWMNFPTINWYADRKLIQLQNAPKFGLQVPPWLISSNKKQISEFLMEQWFCSVWK